MIKAANLDFRPASWTLFDIARLSARIGNRNSRRQTLDYQRRWSFRCTTHSVCEVNNLPRSFRRIFHPEPPHCVAFRMRSMFADRRLRPRFQNRQETQ
jgi:hypothetical protein